MNPGVTLLCALMCLTAVGCDRVYVHPFFLTAINNNSCKAVEYREQQVKTFGPISIEWPFASMHEQGPWNKSEERENHPGVTYLVDQIYIVGARFYQKLREIHKGENMLLSPTFIYESLLSLYLGTSGRTATDLQILLGFDSPSIDPNCTSKVDGHKVFSALRSLVHCPFHPKEEDGLFLSKLSCFFLAPGIHLSESIARELATPDVSFYIRAVNFTNPTKAAEQISAFVEDKSTHKGKDLQENIDPETSLLLATYTQLKALVNGATLLKEPQEFWLDSDTKISVPMMTVTGTFEYKCDGNPNLSVIKVPVSQCVFLLLLLPTNSSQLAIVEDQYSMTPSRKWLENLSPRQIHLTLPKVSFQSVYNLQELLVKQNMADLLGKTATFRALSNTNVTVGKIINQQLFELSPTGTDQAEAATEQNEATETLKIRLDKPFLFAVYERELEALLYFGRVTKPRKGT
ncbi:angiotensinogen [Elgaria multicarinata webbii]|uniref:angiotensinogen n=1 Tax=Elgaria multicarinata webbii TaxID=159646 RepID=UPI002FCCEBC4